MRNLPRRRLVLALIPLLMLLIGGCQSEFAGLKLGEIKVDSALDGQFEDTRQTVDRVRIALEDKEVLTEGEEELANELIGEIAEINEDGILLEAELRSLDRALSIAERRVKIETDEDLLEAIQDVGVGIAGAPESASQEIEDLLKLFNLVGSDLSTKVSTQLNDLSNEIPPMFDDCRQARPA